MRKLKMIAIDTSTVNTDTCASTVIYPINGVDTDEAIRTMFDDFGIRAHEREISRLGKKLFSRGIVLYEGFKMELLPEG